MIAALLVLLAASGSDDELMLRARIDPFVTIVAGGASVGVDIARKNDPFRVSIAAFVVDAPRLMVPLISSAGPSMKMTESCVQLGVMTSLSPEHRGFFVGPELFAYRLLYSDDVERVQHAVGHELYVHVTGGYTWFPFSRGPGDHDNGIVDDVFVMPWATVGAPVFGTGGVVFADGVVVRDRIANFHATVSIGLQL